MYSHSSRVTKINNKRIAVHGGEFFGSHVRLIDVEPSSPEFMTEIGSFKVQDEVSVHNVMAFGNKAYVAHYQQSVRILDISDPTNPKEVGRFVDWSPDGSSDEMFDGVFGIDVDLQRNRIYVANSPTGLWILDDHPPD